MGVVVAGSPSSSVPQGGWAVQQTGAVCVASRTFLVDGAAIGVGLEPLPLGTSTGVIVVENDASKGVEIGSVTITRGAGSTPHSANYSSWPAANNQRIVRFSIPDDNLGSLDAASIVTINWGGKALDISLDGFPLEAVEQCDARTLGQIGIDVPSERRIPTRPRLLSKSGAASGDYPVTAIRRGEQGVVDMILQIDQGGRVTDCRIANSSGYDELDAASCKSARHARYAPARDAQGNPVAAHLSTQSVWSLPDRGTPPPHGLP
jgi:TonB family protein